MSKTLAKLGKNLYVSFKDVSARFNASFLGGLLMDDLKKWPQVRPDALVVFGAGEVSGAVAKRAAEFVAEGNLPIGGTIYFAGGVRPWSKPFAEELIPVQKNNGIPAPAPHIEEAPYMETIFRSALREKGVDPDLFLYKIDDKSTNTQENIRNVKALGVDKHEVVGIVALPYHARRVIGTWRKEAGNKAVLRPVLAWPNEAGITQDNWRQSQIARVVVADEAKKYILPKPEKSFYVAKKKYAYAADVDLEYAWAADKRDEQIALKGEDYVSPKAFIRQVNLVLSSLGMQKFGR
jgi:uncharacterized SAM-binding protein YcdF (DUF218 family)